MCFSEKKDNHLSGAIAYYIYYTGIMSKLTNDTNRKMNKYNWADVRRNNRGIWSGGKRTGHVPRFQYENSYNNNNCKKLLLLLSDTIILIILM